MTRKGVYVPNWAFHADPRPIHPGEGKITQRLNDSTTTPPMSRHNKLTLSSALLAILLIATTTLTTLPAHANTPPPWTVSLDADSTSPTDASIQTSHTIQSTTTITVGAIINASSAIPVNNVYAWQFYIVYDNTTLAPDTVQFGAQTGSGNPNWAGQISSNAGFGSHSTLSNLSSTECGCDPSTHRELAVYFAFLGQNPGVSIAPVLSASVQGNLLANVNFTLVKTTTATLSLKLTSIIFEDNSQNAIPNIIAGDPITEAANTIPPSPSSQTPTETPYVLLGIATAIITAALAVTLLRRRSRKKPPTNPTSRPVQPRSHPQQNIIRPGTIDYSPSLRSFVRPLATRPGTTRFFLGARGFAGPADSSGDSSNSESSSPSPDPIWRSTGGNGTSPY